MITVHLIPQAHLDPIWLWPWTAGLDEAIATCRTACDLLDRHADLTFNLGEAWVLEQIERVDPGTFERIRGFVASDRWDLAGGWFIQPDCNFPLAESISRQIDLGRGYLQRAFDRWTDIAMNVDSFGHAAALPTLMRRAGQKHYVMMRPQEHEMKLPARLFRWRDPSTGESVTTFRIADAYCTPGGLTLAHIRASLTELPQGVQHTMCFFGVSDHGGGPTEEMIDFCRANAHAIDGARLVFSTPARFFRAVETENAPLPTVDLELQFHAVGCYSVESRLKRSVRRAEHQLLQAERCRAMDPAPLPDAAARLHEGWRSVCFHEFHDTIGGTCLPSAYEFVRNDVGGASAEAERQIVYALRRKMLRDCGDDPLQRIVLFNPSPTEYDGYVEVEPWCEFTPWQDNWRLLNEAGTDVAYQRISGEALADPIDRVLLRVKLPPDGLKTVRIDRRGAPGRADPVEQQQRRTDLAGLFQRIGTAVPVLQLIDDTTDTWSHRIDRYSDEPVAVFASNDATLIEEGPILTSVFQQGAIGSSDLSAEWRTYRDEPFVELRLRVDWREQHKVLKLSWNGPAAPSERIDGTLGGSTPRPADGREYPIQDWLLVRHQAGPVHGVVCPDVFAADVSAKGIRLTLLRSPILAHHDPNPGTASRRTYADRGEHTFRFRFYGGGKVEPAALIASAAALHRPPVVADLTRGMPARRKRGET